jgi:hypothetical protein
VASSDVSSRAPSPRPAPAVGRGAGQTTPLDRPLDPEAEARLRAEIGPILARHRERNEQEAAEARARRWFWLTHHWPEHYAERCVRVGSRHFCRRCSALYPIGFAVAFAAATGRPLWPDAWDPLAIWLLCLPGTVAFSGEMLGWFGYSRRWQVGTTLIAALAFGKALGYELVERWSPEFWGPIAVFGGLWFFASVAGHRRRARG